MEELILRRFRESVEVKERVIKAQLPVLARMGKWVVESLEKGGKVVLFGNGGSAADAQHFAAEMVGRFLRERKGLPAIALTTNTSILTSVGNDYGFEDVFSRQIEALGKEGDVAIGISTSGNAPSVLKGVEVARRKGMRCVGFTGGKGGKLASLVDLCFTVPSSSTPRIQEVHITALHIIAELVEESLFGEKREG